MSFALHTLLTLFFTPGLGPRRIKALFEHFGPAEAFTNASALDLRATEGVGPKLA